MAKTKQDVKFNGEIVEAVYYLIDDEFQLEAINYEGINVKPLLSDIDIEEITEQIRKDNE